MRNVSTTDLRAHLGNVLHDVFGGETVRITRNNRTVAYIVTPSTWDGLNTMTGAQLAEACGVSLDDVEARIRAIVIERGRTRVIAQDHHSTAEKRLLWEAAETVYQRLRSKEG